MVLSSIKPKYDNPSEQFDGITLPGELKKWFLAAGYKTVVDHTNLIYPKDLQTLLRAQIDYASGSAICLLVDGDVFLSLKNKNGSSLFPNHWVALNSAIKIQKYDEATRSLKAPLPINPLLAKTILNELKEKQEVAEEEADLYDNEVALSEAKDRILLNAFTWGKQNVPVYSRISALQDARLQYFLQGFYGYIKAKG